MLKDREMGKKIGFAPTMGALHKVTFLFTKLLKRKRRSYFFHFVNPTQFNNPDDFQKYPKTLEKT